MPSKLKSVILVGFHRHPATAALAEQLQSFGYQISQADTPDEISSLLSGRPRSAVAVFSPKRTGDVHRVLTALDGCCHEVPLVVIGFGVAFSLVTAGTLGVWSFIVSHRICGPLFVIERFIGELASGRFPKLRPLRQKDEFKSFYASFPRWSIR